VALPVGSAIGAHYTWYITFFSLFDSRKSGCALYMDKYSAVFLDKTAKTYTMSQEKFLI